MKRQTARSRSIQQPERPTIRRPCNSAGYPQAGEVIGRERARRSLPPSPLLPLLADLCQGRSRHHRARPNRMDSHHIGHSSIRGRASLDSAVHSSLSRPTGLGTVFTIRRSPTGPAASATEVARQSLRTEETPTGRSRASGEP